MPLFFWDASALAKRYALETGSAVVDAIFASVSRSAMLSTTLNYVETFSILLRRLNSSALDRLTFNTAVSLLQTEIIQDPDFVLLSVSDADIMNSLTFMAAHNLNATDSILLATLQSYLQSLGRTDCVVVSSDKRLLRAAVSEGYRTINPELLGISDLPSLLQSF